MNKISHVDKHFTWDHLNSGNKNFINLESYNAAKPYRLHNNSSLLLSLCA